MVACGAPRCKRGARPRRARQAALAIGPGGPNPSDAQLLDHVVVSRTESASRLAVAETGSRVTESCSGRQPRGRGGKD